MLADSWAATILAGASTRSTWPSAQSKRPTVLWTDFWDLQNNTFCFDCQYQKIRACFVEWFVAPIGQMNLCWIMKLLTILATEITFQKIIAVKIAVSYGAKKFYSINHRKKKASANSGSLSLTSCISSGTLLADSFWSSCSQKSVSWRKSKHFAVTFSP